VKRLKIKITCKSLKTLFTRLIYIKRGKMVSKKGMSGVVTTLIIILLVIAAIGIIWVVLKNFIQSSSEQISLDKFTIDLDIKNAYVDQVSGNVSVVVGRGSGQGDLVGIKFIIIDKYLQSEVFESKENLPTGFGTTTFSFITTLSPDEVDSVSVAPMYRNSVGKEVLGEISDTFKIPTGGGIPIGGGTPSQPQQPQCTPVTCESLGNYECGSYQNGTCAGTLDCGTCSLPTPYCQSGRCVESCTPNCTGRVCGDDGCGGTSCGNCTEGICNATGQCCSDTCNLLGYACGMWSICGILTNCTEEIGCGAGEFCNSTDGACFIPTPEVVNATLINLWPPGLNIFMDSEEFPKSLGVNYVNYYLKADPNSGAQDANCYLISTYQTPYNETLYNRTYLKLSAYFTNLNANNKVNIWKEAEWCLAE